MLKKELAIFACLTTWTMSAGCLGADDSAANRPIRDKWALVVGISDFSDPKLNLHYSAKDAQDFAQYLKKEAGFAPDHVKVLINKDATQRRILAELGDKWLPRVANPDDLVVLFISTHGSGAEMDVGGQNYLVASDTDVNNLYTTGIPMQKLAHDIKERVHCDRVVVFLDACHSGATEVGAKGLVRTGVDAGEFAAGSGQLVIASSKDDQVSWESKKGSNGVFTACLLEALRSKSGHATIGQTFASLKDNVQDTVLRERGILQTPVMSSQWQGNDILIAAEPVARHPGLEEEASSVVGSLGAPASAGTTVSSPPGAPASGTNTGTTNTGTQGTTPPILGALVTGGFTGRLHSSSVGTTPAASTVDDAHSVLKLRGATGAPAPHSLLNTPPAVHSSVSSSSSPAPVSPRCLIVPGLSVGRIKIGMSKAEALQMLGKPTSVNGDTLTYWTGDRRLFLSVKLVNDVISEIAFSSPVFRTEDGISVANFSGSDKTKAALKNATMTVRTLMGGGYSVVAPTDNTCAVGVVHKEDLNLNSLTWLPHGPVSSEPEPAKPAVTAVGGKNTVLSTAYRIPTVHVTNLVVPGVSLAKAKLGMSKDEILNLLGKPDEEKDDVFTYWSGSGKSRYFLSLRFSGGTLSDLAYSSPAFATAAGINVSNFNNFPDQFSGTKKDATGAAELYPLKGGGLSMVIRDGSTFGWLHSLNSKTNSISWVAR